MQTINKEIKNKIDNLKDWDYIAELDYTILSIEDWIYEVSSSRFDCACFDYNEMFEKLFENRNLA